MILVIWHPVYDFIKLCDVNTVEEGFDEVNKYLRINKLETVGADTRSAANASGISVYLGRYEYPSKSSFRMMRCSSVHEYQLYSIDFIVFYEKDDLSVPHIRNFSDIKNIDLPMLIPEGGASVVRFKDDKMAILHKPVTGWMGWPNNKKWAYPAGYNHIKTYLEDLEARKKGN